VFHKPVKVFDVLVVLIQALRICTFTVLPCSYLVLCNQNESPDNDEAERQSLLTNEATPNVATSMEVNSTEYGTTADAAKKASTDVSKKKSKNKAKSGPSTAHDPADDAWLKKRREAEERQAKRLMNDGNWWTYVKGFSVSDSDLFPRPLFLRLTFLSRSSSHFSFRSIIGICKYVLG
jgi:hypothetical protein